MKHKLEVFEKFEIFKEMINCQISRSIKVFRNDNGAKYISRQFDEYWKANDRVRDMAVSHTPRRNIVAERFNRTIAEIVQSVQNFHGLRLWQPLLIFAIDYRINL